jgi:hypothetical protein
MGIPDWFLRRNDAEPKVDGWGNMPVDRATMLIASMFAALLTLMTACKPVSPNLTTAEAAELISQAPEFNRYAQLLTMDSAARDGDSMADCCYHGYFTFRHLNAEFGVPPIRAYAEFRYYDAVWHVSDFSYGCPAKCKSVNVGNPALKGRTPY